jgi:hypothetical protein
MPTLRLVAKLDSQYISQSGQDIMYRNKTNVIICLLHMKNALRELFEYAKLITPLPSSIKIKIPRNGQTPTQASVPLKSEGAGEGQEYRASVPLKSEGAGEGQEYRQFGPYFIVTEIFSSRIILSRDYVPYCCVLYSTCMKEQCTSSQ